MEQFKLKSIDEFDLEFVTKTRGQIHNNTQPAQTTSEIKSTSQPEDISSGSYFTKPAQSLNEEPVYSPQPEKQVKKPRPLVPIGQNSAGYSPVGAPTPKNDAPFIPNVDYDEVQTEEPPKKKSKGALAGKIISIVLLAATVVVFVFGCFISIFLDNGGSNIGGLCFNTMSTDLEMAGVSPVSSGDLIISKLAEPNEYASGDMIAVPSATLSGCDIHIINTVNYMGDDAELITTDITSVPQCESAVMATGCYGIVSSYIPALGGLISFAMDNAILVCILFVLLAAFWCLLLVLLEKSGKPASNSKPKKNN